MRWAAGWTPATATAGVPFAVDAIPGTRSLTLDRDGALVELARVESAPLALTAGQPGLYTVSETGAGSRRDAYVAVNTAQAVPVGSQPVDLSATRTGNGGGAPANQAPWFLAAALAMLGLEWAYWVYRRTRVAL